ncbi:unnamed protein product [Rotaria socialis]
MPFGLYDWNVLYQDLRNAPPSLECECGTAVNSTLKSPNSTLTISPHTNILTLRPTTYASDYVCSLENSSVQFTLSNLAHSAWQPSANCALPLCITYSNNNNNSSTCRTSLTPCYDYRTATNMSYCAPGSLCSMLEQCDNVTGGCASNSYVCVVNSCCTPYNVCLPLSWTSLCSSVNDTTSTVVSSTTTASTTSSTTPAPAVLAATTTTTTSTTTTTTTTTTTSTTTTTTTTSTSTSTTTETTTTTTTTTSTSTSSTSTATTTTTTTTRTTTTATTSPPCTKTPNVAGAIFSFSTASIPLTYTRYSYGFTASDSSSTVTFILTGDSGPGQHYWLIDDVSVNDTRNNTDLLTNGDFDDGTFNGWTQFCATDANCGNGLYGQLTTSPCRSAPKCYMDKCNNGRYYDYLLQSFQTVTGNYYILSFYIRAFANGGSHLAYVMLS